MDTKLDLFILDTHNPKYLAIGDASFYKTGQAKVNPTLQVTVPGYDMFSLTFTPEQVTVFNSDSLGITTNQNFINLPDGIYKFKYSIVPAQTLYVEKSFLVVDSLYEKLDAAYLKIALDCSSEKRKDIDEIEFYIQGAISAANSCSDDLANSLYLKANKLLTNFNSNTCC